MSDSKQFTYRNVSEVDQDLIGVGIVPAGELLHTDEPVHNPNFELQKGAFDSKSQAKRVETLKTPETEVTPTPQEQDIANANANAKDKER
jgi:hypothetical protein